MEIAICLIAIVAGAFLRRYKGGSPNPTIVRISGFELPLIICLYMGFNIVLSLALAGFVTFGWLMPKHGFGMGMGRYPVGRPLWLSYGVMTAQYGGLTLLAGLVWEWLLPHSGGLYYAPMGCIIPLGYLVSWNVWEKYGIKPSANMDSPTCLAEYALGAVLLGGLPLSNIMATFL